MLAFIINCLIYKKIASKSARLSTDISCLATKLDLQGFQAELKGLTNKNQSGSIDKDNIFYIALWTDFSSDPSFRWIKKMEPTTIEFSDLLDYWTDNYRWNYMDFCVVGRLF